MLNFMIYNIVIYGVYSFIDFLCIQLGFYKAISFENLTNTTIYILVFNTFLSMIIGYFIMRYIKRNFLLDSK